MRYIVSAVTGAAMLGLAAGAVGGIVLNHKQGPAIVQVVAVSPTALAEPSFPSVTVTPGVDPAAPVPSLVPASPPAPSPGSGDPTPPTDLAFDPPQPGSTPSAPTGATVAPPPPVGVAAGPAVPANSGSGRRIIWGKTANHVWVVAEGEVLVRSYPVTDLDEKTPPGTYQVLRMSDMSYADTEEGRQSLAHFIAFFKRCDSCSFIGFHAIPRDESGNPVQPDSALGTEEYHSHGCIRQSEADAEFLFGFAGIGTPVVVVP